MDLVFVRNQIEIKLDKLQNLLSYYSQGIQKELHQFDDFISESQKSEYKKHIYELAELVNDTENIKDDFNIVVEQLTVIYSEYLELTKAQILLQKEAMTSIYDGIKIVRDKLKYSGLAISAGYNAEHEIMDMEYSTGGVYRYFKVPQEFYKTVQMRSSFKGLKKDLSAFDFVKIS